MIVELYAVTCVEGKKDGEGRTRVAEEDGRSLVRFGDFTISRETNPFRGTLAENTPTLIKYDS
jgi:hypothetical protein